jgi:serine O-acetyltransferase
MKGLIDHAASQEHQITMLWQAIETLSKRPSESVRADCVPPDAQTTDQFNAAALSQLVK